MTSFPDWADNQPGKLVKYCKDILESGDYKKLLDMILKILETKMALIHMFTSLHVTNQSNLSIIFCPCQSQENLTNIFKNLGDHKNSKVAG